MNNLGAWRFQEFLNLYDINFSKYQSFGFVHLSAVESDYLESWTFCILCAIWTANTSNYSEAVYF
jgi:hypothetical protein